MIPLVNYSPFANLVRTDVSIKPANWTEKSDPDLYLVKGAELSVTSSSVIGGQTLLTVRRRADLRYADAYRAFLAKANLSGAYLEGADLRFSDLRQAYAELEGVHLNDADLTGANLSGAQLPYSDLRDVWLPGAELTNAELTGAILKHTNLSGVILKHTNLSGADLTDAQFEGADLTFADFRSLDNTHQTKGLAAPALKAAKNWDKAYYDDDLGQQLGLPRDHNDRLAEEQQEGNAKAQSSPCAPLRDSALSSDR